MGKIDINKVSGFDPIRAEKQPGVKKPIRETSPPVQPVKTDGPDKLHFSSRTSGIGKLVQQIKGLPEVRSEKVEAIRNQISADSYKPSSDEIAEAILKDESI